MIFKVPQQLSTTELQEFKFRIRNNPKIYYNSIYVSGIGTNNMVQQLCILYRRCTNVEAKDDIFVNTRDESPYWAAFIHNYSGSNFTSDYNDLFH